MRHSYFGRKLSRNTNERKRLLSGLLRDFIIRGSIITTVAKAKSAAPLMEKLITKAKVGTEQKRREVAAVLPYREVVKKLWEEGRDRFSGRTSGFVRIVKLGKRRGDASEMAKMVFVDAPVVVPEMATPVKEATVKKETKKTTTSKKTV